MNDFIFPLELSLKVAGMGTAASFTAAVPLAYWVSKRSKSRFIWADAFFLLPMVLPPTVVGYFLLVLFGRSGVFGMWLYEHFGVRIVFSIWGAGIAAAVAAFPLLYRSARGAFENNAKLAEEAALDLGASPMRVFFDISLPLAARGIIAGIVLAFARAVGEFGATMMIAGNLPGKTQTLSLAIYDAVQSGNEERAMMLVFLTSVVCIIMLSTAEFLFRDRGKM